MPRRRSDNSGRRLLADPVPDYVRSLQDNLQYEGSSKHKQHPHRYGLDPFRGRRGDETLCDRDAGFDPDQMRTIPDMIERSLQAGLVGKNGMVWAVADNGWIYEARITNIDRPEYHGYPVRDSEAIAQPVYERFAKWAGDQGDERASLAAENCKRLYGFR